MFISMFTLFLLLVKTTSLSLALVYLVLGSPDPNFRYRSLILGLPDPKISDLTLELSTCGNPNIMDRTLNIIFLLVKGSIWGSWGSCHSTWPGPAGWRTFTLSVCSTLIGFMPRSILVYWPLIGQYRYRFCDVNTGLWLVNTDHMRWISKFIIL